MLSVRRMRRHRTGQHHLVKFTYIKSDSSLPTSWLFQPPGQERKARVPLTRSFETHLGTDQSVLPMTSEGQSHCTVLLSQPNPTVAGLGSQGHGEDGKQNEQMTQGQGESRAPDTLPFPQSSVPCDVTGRNFITPPGDETHPLNTSALLRCQLALVTIVRAWPSAAVSQARVQSSPLQTKYPPAKKPSRFLTEKTETESGWLRGGLNPWTFTQNYKLLLFS